MNEKHVNTRKKLRIIGAILIPLGICLIVGGFVGAFESGIFGLMALNFPGVLCIGAGAFMLIITVQGSLMRFTKNETVPVFNEMGQQIAPGISGIAAATKAGLEDTVTCECGTANDKDAKFCKNCGKPLKSICPNCGKQLDSNSKFCQECGKQL